jgi:hypothetical protein
MSIAKTSQPVRLSCVVHRSQNHTRMQANWEVWLLNFTMANAFANGKPNRRIQIPELGGFFIAAHGFGQIAAGTAAAFVSPAEIEHRVGVADEDGCAITADCVVGLRNAMGKSAQRQEI